MGIDSIWARDPRILFVCPGEIEPDPELLRFGIVDPTPWSCRELRGIRWKQATPDLRFRAMLAERAHLALEGLT